MKTLKIYYIDTNYINYLRKFDNRVAYNKTKTRPYVGVVYTFNNQTYFAPLSSPKPKHLTMNNRALDMFKIKDGELGIVNINNMIPTPISCLTEVLPLVKDKQYRKLIIEQTTYLNDHKRELLDKVKQFKLRYDKGHLSSRLRKRCCDFNLLEKNVGNMKKKKFLFTVKKSKNN